MCPESLFKGIVIVRVESAVFTNSRTAGSMSMNLEARSRFILTISKKLGSSSIDEVEASLLRNDLDKGFSLQNIYKDYKNMCGSNNDKNLNF